MCPLMEIQAPRKRYKRPAYIPFQGRYWENMLTNTVICFHHRTTLFFKKKKERKRKQTPTFLSGMYTKSFISDLCSVVQKVLKLTSILWLLWLQMVEILGFTTLTFYVPLGRHFPRNQTVLVTYMNVFSANLWYGCFSVCLCFLVWFFLLGLKLSRVERKKILICIIWLLLFQFQFNFKELIVLLCLCSYMAIQYGNLIISLIADEES